MRRACSCMRTRSLREPCTNASPSSGNYPSSSRGNGPGPSAPARVPVPACPRVPPSSCATREQARYLLGAALVLGPSAIFRSSRAATARAPSAISRSDAPAAPRAPCSVAKVPMSCRACFHRCCPAQARPVPCRLRVGRCPAGRRKRTGALLWRSQRSPIACAQPNDVTYLRSGFATLISCAKMKIAARDGNSGAR